MILEQEYKKETPLKHRKKFAQFFTPEPVAQLMVDWVLQTPNLTKLLEPAFGLGIFSRLILKNKEDVNIKAFDIDENIFNIAKQNFDDKNNINYFLEDYLFNDWNNKYDAIICNPPYFKFHDYENKETLEEVKTRLKIDLSGFTNIYTLFLLKSICQLKENGRIAYIVPSEFLNANYGQLIKKHLLETNTLKEIIIFDFKENVFDDALTTSAILLLEKSNSNTVLFSKISCLKELQNYPNIAKLKYQLKDLNPNIKWRKYYTKQVSDKYKNLIPFREVARVMRGIATGANDYFKFNREKTKIFNIPKECLLPCITASKYVSTPFFTKKDFQDLEKNNKYIYLIDACANDTDVNIQNYIEVGKEQFIHKRYLTSKRTPWFSLENRLPAPIWVGVFNRNGLKFIRNEANIHNLTTFHCIYPNQNLSNTISIDLLFAYLLTDIAKQILDDNRREYGGGLRKFEPNDLNNSMMLDLSKLDKETESKIMNLYLNYRISVINQSPDEQLINEINAIMLEKYSI